MRYRILGPLDVLDAEGRSVPLGGRHERVLLATLLLDANRVVSSDRLVDAIWGEQPPETAANALQVHVSRLRKRLTDRSEPVGALRTEAPGYVIRPAPGELDAEVFEQLAGTRPGEIPHDECVRLTEALSLWRGPVLDGIDPGVPGRTAVVRLEEMRISVTERRIEADLVLGRHREVTGELEALVIEHPLRERLRELLMVALYRSGRQAEALAVYRDARETLADELGIDPGRALQELELAVLQQSPDLNIDDGAKVTVVGTGRPSGTVTFLFTDVEGSTRLWERDPDAMDAALRRHDEIVRSAIESHSGYIFKTVGDAFCAAFAAAQMAADAAADIQRRVSAETWPENAVLRVRVALHTGECRERDGDYFGPPVNRVARLVSVAHAGQAVSSRTTADVLGDALPPGLELRTLGIHRLKDLSRPEEVFQLVIDGVDTTFPPLRSLDNPNMPNNLPDFVSSFVGRVAELVAVRRLVEESRLVTLAGPGGVGKTRLALQVAAELLDGSGDGVWLVSLETATDPDSVPREVARVLGVREQAGRHMHEILVEALVDRSVLVVLDNCEHLIGECAKLAEVLLRGCPHLHLLTTSREPLAIDGERVFRVPTLSVPSQDADRSPDIADSEAMTLFVERARTHADASMLTEDSAPLVADICRRLEGIPYAIELAAARLRSMPLPLLHDRLQERFKLLSGGSRTGPGRRQSLRTMLDWSYQLLNPMEQSLLARLAVFAGGFELEAAEAVCGFGALEELEVADLIGSLVDKSLVQAELTETDARYRLLETIRHYATEELDRRGEREVLATRSSHARFFLSLAEVAEAQLSGPDQGRWLARLDAERANLRQALLHLAEAPGGAAEAVGLGVALERFWRTRGYYGEGLELLSAALGDADPAGYGLLGAKALKTLGMLSVYLGDSSAALADYQKALAIAAPLENLALMAELYHLVSFVRYLQGDYDTARALGDEALATARLSGVDQVVALTLVARGSRRDGPAHEVEADFSEALALFRKAGDTAGVMHALHNLGYKEIALGEHDAAWDHLQEARSLALSLRDKDFEAFALQNLGIVALLRGEVATASACEMESLALARRLNDRGLVPYNVLTLALCASAAHELERAAVLHGAADALLAALDETFEPLEADLRLADHAHLRRLMEEATFDARYQEGRAMSYHQVVEFALGSIEG